MAERLLVRYGKGIGSLELIPSSGGVFEVSVDGAKVFSKKQLKRFPDDGEIEALIDGRAPDAPRKQE